jgi:hypothetical protein
MRCLQLRLAEAMMDSTGWTRNLQQTDNIISFVVAALLAAMLVVTCRRIYKFLPAGLTSKLVYHYFSLPAARLTVIYEHLAAETWKVVAGRCGTWPSY